MKQASPAVRFTSTDETSIEGILAPFGGPFNGRDLYQEYFSPRTNFALDWFKGARPLLYQHGLDDSVQLVPVGTIHAVELRADAGLWMRAQLDASSDYFDAITELIRQNKLYLSSGAMAHLVNVNARTGEILTWPLIEGSLTPTPANLLARVDFATAEKHCKSAGLTLPRRLALRAVSWEDISEEVGALVDQRLVGASPFEPDCSCVVEETYSDYCIVCVVSSTDERERYYQVPFTLGADGHVASIGEAVEVEETYTPVTPNAPIGAQAMQVAQRAAVLAERTKDLRERRVKEGRVLSTANRRLLTEAADAMRAAETAIRNLLDGTDPAAKAALVARARALVLLTKTHIEERG